MTKNSVKEGSEEVHLSFQFRYSNTLRTPNRASLGSIEPLGSNLRFHEKGVVRRD